jgi:hypothetical protein
MSARPLGVPSASVQPFNMGGELARTDNTPNRGSNAQMELQATVVALGNSLGFGSEQLDTMRGMMGMSMEEFKDFLIARQQHGEQKMAH